MTRTLFALVLVGLISQASAAVLDNKTSTHPRDQAITVFGTHDRQEMTSKKLPWGAIGRLVVLGDKVGENKYKVESTCTGTLVGPRHVLTAAHCVVDFKKGTITSRHVVFQLGYQNGNYIAESFVNRYAGYALGATVHLTSENIEGDWAVVQLQDNLGEKYGYLAVTTMSSEEISSSKKNSTAVGYSHDFKDGQVAGVHSGCSITGANGNRFKLDCDYTQGASGGPILQRLTREVNGKEYVSDYVIGILTTAVAEVVKNEQGEVIEKPFPNGTEYKDKIANGGLASRTFIFELIEMLNEYKKNKK